ncbi:polypeptide deformylase [Capsaspora owczarzaki ATCC 30864]|uniref:Peptide deformylase n=1 Tax=Capsaspora owczarzaki (strain ATCC 30864) TaxID=595528 RepID=A0A0D2X335_CAPO3|nr:polypeptide deformylase [Capsaspora owczarzaki ATCC 30864]KJE93619.1 polypeptide deformylase [Capsaspora owczarzaki ATCC 30864]|eukprot:XP_004348206.1 polypeptide deformylase [Capsaspora owczarzaki ATCC 30864]
MLLRALRYLSLLPEHLRHRGLLAIGEDSLRLPSRQVSLDELRSSATQALIDRMIATMRRTEGVGIAAVQLGDNRAIACIEFTAKHLAEATPEMAATHKMEAVPLTVMVNPRVLRASSDLVEGAEGCLSVPGMQAIVFRPRHVAIDCLDRNGAPQTLKLSGWSARIAMHEVDHLKGELFTDKMERKSLAVMHKWLHW